MLRIVDVAAALEARGYPAGLEAQLELEVEDELLAWNHGRLRLSVADGREERLESVCHSFIRACGARPHGREGMEAPTIARRPFG